MSVVTVYNRDEKRAAIANREGGRSTRSALQVFPLLVAATSRGLFEEVAGKPLAYLFQLLGVVGILLYLSIRSRPGRSKAFKSALSTYAVLGVACALSTIGTTVVHPELSLLVPLTYIAVTMFIGGMLFMSAAYRWPEVSSRSWTIAIFALALLQCAAGLWQQILGSRVLPGWDIGTFGGTVRPSGVTGSYIHYPLVLIALAALALGLWESNRGRLNLITFALCVGCAIWSMSRSAMMICGFAVFFSIFTRRFFTDRLIAVVGLVALMGGALGGLFSGPTIARAMSSLDLGSSGNVGRVQRWSIALEDWTDGPLIIGTDTGLITNVTRTFGSASVGVVESSLLQQLLNVGLFGALATYGLLFASLHSIPRAYAGTRAIILGCIIETVIVQSIEILPYMFLIALCPMLVGSARGPAALSLSDSKISREYR